MRLDRRPGLAQDQAARVHEGCRYDLTVDTSVSSPAACASAVIEALGLRAESGTSKHRGGS